MPDGGLNYRSTSFSRGPSSYIFFDWKSSLSFPLMPAGSAAPTVQVADTGVAGGIPGIAPEAPTNQPWGTPVEQPVDWSWPLDRTHSYFTTVPHDLWESKSHAQCTQPTRTKASSSTRNRVRSTKERETVTKERQFFHGLIRTVMTFPTTSQVGHRGTRSAGVFLSG